MKIQTATMTQSGNEILGKKETTLYYVVLENKKGEKITIGIGEKNHKAITTLINNDK